MSPQQCVRSPCQRRSKIDPQAAKSEGSNPEGLGEGPHCHVLITGPHPVRLHASVSSHTAHLASGVGHVLAADPNCDGLPGS